MDFFKILKGGVGVGMSNFDRLFAEKHGGEDWQLTTLTGTLPLTFQSKGTPLTDYKLYGTSEGAGVETESGEPSGYKLPMTVTSEEETENLFSGKGEIRNMGAPSIKQFIESNMQVSPGETYCINASSALYSRLGFYMSNTRKSGSYWISTQSSITVPDDCDNMYVEVRNYDYIAVTDEQLATATEIMLTKGSTPPDHYIPYRYSTTTPIYIGDSKLMAEEYVDFVEQKVYKRTENLFDKSTAILGKEIQGSSIVDNVDWAITPLIPVEPQSYYSALSFGVARLEYMSENDNNPTRTAASSQNPTLSTTHFIRLNLAISNLTTATLVSGSTPPETYIPYLQPTDPPAALPELSTYQGENTLSCSEGLGEISITGYIKGE